MKINKQHVVGALYGIALIIMIYLSYVFYTEIKVVNDTAVKTSQIIAWACKVDPTTCGKEAPKVVAPTASSATPAK